LTWDINWDALGALGEIVGAVAVIATLFYFARQIRQAANQMEMQSNLQFLTSLDGVDQSFSRFREFLIVNEDVAALWDKARDNFDDLGGTDRTRADQLLFEYFVIYQNFYLRFGQIAIPAIAGRDVAGAMKSLMASDLDHSGLRYWWRHNSHRFSTPEFVELINEFVSDLEHPPSPADSPTAD
jgi:hypothetical protein